jgi:hypothetical protein
MNHTPTPVEDAISLVEGDQRPAHRSTPRTQAATPPRWSTPVLVGTAVLSVLTLLPAVAAATSPLVVPNEMQELGYPLVAAPLGMLMVLIAQRIVLRTSSRWAGLLAFTGVGWTVNALLVALRSWGGDGHGPHALFVAATWVGQFSYVWPDVATFVLLPMALPTGRIFGAWRWVAGIVAASAVVQVVCAALGGGQMDDAAVSNPFTGSAMSGLIGVRDDLYLPTMLIGVIAVLVRAVSVRHAEPVRYAGVLACSVIGLLLATVLEGSLQAMDVPCYVPWLPVAVIIPACVLAWTRVVIRTADAR